MKQQNVYLIGMMGSGKSTVGKVLAERTKLKFIDVDKEIENVMDMTIAQIFNEYGEKHFRLLETTFFKERIKNNHIIYSTGGGIILDKENQTIFKKSGKTFFLDCSPKTILERLKSDNNKRPLLNNNSKSTISKLYKDRQSLYKSCSDYIINADKATPNDIATKIEEYLSV